MKSKITQYKNGNRKLTITITRKELIEKEKKELADEMLKIALQMSIITTLTQKEKTEILRGMPRVPKPMLTHRLSRLRALR